MKGKTEGKEETTKNRETEKGLKKGFGRKKRATNLSKIAGHSFCASQIARPVLKTPELQENGVIYDNLKAKQQAEEKKGKPTKKRSRKEEHK